MKDLLQYDHYIVCFSGGKDCTAAFLNLLESGVPKEKIELWHHLVDGKEEVFMDWPVTEAYCRAFAKHFEVPIYFSWKDGGFKKEMLRENSFTAPIFFEKENGELGQSRKGNGKKTTRRRFPQVSADLNTRWCSAYLKIDVCSAAISNQRRFDNKKVLVISGERGEESPCRAKYNIHEKDRADNRYRGTYQTPCTRVTNGVKKTYMMTVTLGRNDRLVDRFRPVKDWVEEQVWAIIERWGIRVHPCYYLGWSRCSCLFCIFGNADQMASADYIAPSNSKEIIAYEVEFGCTIKRNAPLSAVIEKGTIYPAINDQAALVAIARSTEYKLPITISPWILPAGAYGKSIGPS